MIDDFVEFSKKSAERTIFDIYVGEKQIEEKMPDVNTRGAVIRLLVTYGTVFSFGYVCGWTRSAFR